MSNYEKNTNKISIPIQKKEFSSYDDFALIQIICKGTNNPINETERVDAVNAKNAVQYLLLDKFGKNLNYLVKAGFPILNVEFSDLISQLYLKFHNNWLILANFRYDSTLKTYINRMALNILKNIQRKIISLKETEIEVGLNDRKELQKFRDTESQKDIKEWVNHLVDKNLEGNQRLVMLYRLQGITPIEIAKKLNISRNNVDGIYGRAKSNLKEVIQAERL